MPNEDGAGARKLTRREMLLGSVGLLGVGVLAACGGTTAAPSASAPASSAAAGSAAAKPAASASSAAPAASSAAASPAASSGASGSVAASGSAAASGAPGGANSLTLAYTQIANSLDPHVNVNNAAMMYSRQVFDTLISRDPAGQNFIPQLAASWNRVDSSTIDLKLRDDVKFSNGEPFTADTVQFSLNALLTSKDPAKMGVQSVMKPLVSATPIDSTTVRVKTSQPDPLMLNRLCGLFIIPPKYVQGGGDMAKAPVGTGSFKVTGYQPQTRINLQAWDGSWRGPSKIQNATILAMAEPATQVAALKTGEIDIAWNLSGDQVAALKSDFNVGAQDGTSISLCSLLPLIPQFQDVRVRQALNYAVNKDELIKTIMGGFGTISDGQLLKAGQLGYNDALKAFPFDPDKAKSLLSAAGVSNLSVPTIATASYKALDEALTGYLRNVGINLQVTAIEQAVFATNLNVKTSVPLFTWTVDYFLFHDFDGVAERFARPSDPHFPNADFAKLYVQQEQETDDTKRAALIKQASQTMYDQAGALFMFHRQYPVVYSKKISTLTLPWDTSIYFWQVNKSA